MPDTTTTTRPDPGCCPLCGSANRCAMEIERATGEPQPPCWCVAQNFSAALLARLPAGSQHTACICARCVAEDAAASRHETPGT